MMHAGYIAIRFSWNIVFYKTTKMLVIREYTNKHLYSKPITLWQKQFSAYNSQCINTGDISTSYCSC